MDNTNEIEMFSPEEMLSPFEAIKETDGEGREWWNSRKLARLMGYQKYWNFERLMDKVATFLQQEKGLDLKEHGKVIQTVSYGLHSDCIERRSAETYCKSCKGIFHQ